MALSSARSTVLLRLFGRQKQRTFTVPYWTYDFDKAWLYPLLKCCGGDRFHS